MISKKERDEVWERNRRCLNDPATTEDLIPLCRKCVNYKGNTHNYEECRGKPCMELWLSNEYLEWFKSYLYE